MPNIKGKAKEMAFLHRDASGAQEAILGIASREVLMTYKSFSGGSETQIEPWAQQRIPINTERKDC